MSINRIAGIVILLVIVYYVGKFVLKVYKDAKRQYILMKARVEKENITTWDGVMNDRRRLYEESVFEEDSERDGKKGRS